MYALSACLSCECEGWVCFCWDQIIASTHHDICCACAELLRPTMDRSRVCTDVNVTHAQGIASSHLSRHRASDWRLSQNAATSLILTPVFKIVCKTLCLRTVKRLMSLT